MKSKRAKACDISQKVKEIVWERDNHQCIICGNRHAMPNSHFIRRSQGGLGTEENIVTMCYLCHQMYDQYIDRKNMESYIEQYLRSKYPNWDREKLFYKKWED
jgi:5-methylcytosine-specific restriction endonuclease McrA